MRPKSLTFTVISSTDDPPTIIGKDWPKVEQYLRDLDAYCTGLEARLVAINILSLSPREAA